MSIAVGSGGIPEQPPRQREDARLVWSETTVDGRSVRMAVSGSGPAALFLHGWGLRPNAYAEAIRHMGMAGCRVYAPALPGFGGTRELPAAERSFDGYSA